LIRRHPEERSDEGSRRIRGRIGRFRLEACRGPDPSLSLGMTASGRTCDRRLDPRFPGSRIQPEVRQ